MRRTSESRKEEIPNHPIVFSAALYSIFGQGANVIEGLIVQRIKDRFELRLDSQITIVKAIETVKTESRKSRLEQKFVSSGKILSIYHRD